MNTYDTQAHTHGQLPFMKSLRAVLRRWIDRERELISLRNTVGMMSEARRWSSVDRPGRSGATLARIASGRQRHGARFVAPYYGSGSGETGRNIDRPLGTITTRDRWAVIDDDRMRMLSADECRAAMGFPVGYRLPARHKEAVHLLGNAVCPPVAADVIDALRTAA